MALFQMKPPDDVISQAKKIHDDSRSILGSMTRAGAEVAKKKILDRIPHPSMASGVKMSRTYFTPSDDGVNNKVYFTGYAPFSDPNRKYFIRRNRAGGKVYKTDKGVPIAFLAVMFEYGRSGNPFPRRPFFRRAFSAADIEAAMLKEQKRVTGGILDE